MVFVSKTSKQPVGSAVRESGKREVVVMEMKNLSWHLHQHHGKWGWMKTKALRSQASEMRLWARGSCLVTALGIKQKDWWRREPFHSR